MTDSHEDLSGLADVYASLPPYRYPDTSVFHVDKAVPPVFRKSQAKPTLEDPPYWNLTEFPPVLVLAAGIAGGFGLGVLLTIVFLQTMWGIR